MPQPSRHSASAHHLGDFLVSPRLIPLSVLAVGIGLVSALVATLLLRLIGLFTNLFFYQRFDTDLTSPAGSSLGPLAILVPVVGSLIIGLMARYGSERIRGHGIPEAIEAILINGSRVQPRLAILKPLSSAISIGSGGPFGAEGPIIMTGGAVGSMLAQTLHLSNNERKILLVAGAAGGMSATFAAPMAAVLLAVELLLFEWRPRSLIPVALSSAAAAAARGPLLGDGPIFPVPALPADLSPQALLACALCGVLAGALSALLTLGVYAAEDGFGRLPIHWMWWPALGGLVVGVGGFLFPPALGVGYDTLGTLLAGQATVGLIVGVLLVKSTIWVVSLGSGTSGGVLAPLLMMGAALGALEGQVFPGEGAGFWPLISMAAILGGTMRSPLTGIVFALELTHEQNALLPLLIAVPVAYAFTVLTMRRSILTEKISRRGLHLSREYAVDPLETTFVRQVMRSGLVTFAATDTVASTRALVEADGNLRRQRLYPLVDGQQRLVAVATLSNLLDSPADSATTLTEVGSTEMVVSHPDESLRAVVHQMAEHGVSRMPVVSRADPQELLGIVTLSDLLRARERQLKDEHHRERVLRLPGAARSSAEEGVTV
jgi:H+/Cl- antiporter ClcA/CBS domain-containing protein